MQRTQSFLPWRRLRRLAPIVLTAALLAVPFQSAQAVPAWQITTVDGTGNVGEYTSLVLDAAGNPVISYYEVSDPLNPGPTGNLKLVHCNDATCSGGDESIRVIDSTDNVGQFTSLALNSAGHPVISYQNGSNDLKLAICSDANCSGTVTFRVLDNNGNVGEYTALALDDADNPVISYYEAYDLANPDTTGNLKLARCSNATCTAGNVSVEVVDSTGNVGQYTSLALDSAGLPVISYRDATSTTTTINLDLKLARCDDANCAGGNESLQVVDSSGNVGQYTSLALNGGNPVISYYDVTNTNLKLARCSDTGCAPGNVTTLTVDNAGSNGTYNSLALDGAGNHVISYRNATNQTLKLACGDPACTPFNVSTQVVDSSANVGQFTSLVLDTDGLPVISYYDVTNGDLKLARLVNDAPPSVTVNQAAGQADPTNASPVRFTVIFSEAVTGFSGGDVTLAGSAGATTATVTELPPNDGTTYDVAVSGMTVSGTVVASVAANVVTDSGGNGNTASTSTDNIVTWNLQANAPVANAQTVTTTVGVPVSIVLTASGGNGGALTYSVVAGPQHGTLQGSAPTLTYTPNPGYEGSDQLSFQASDGQSSSNVATVTIKVVTGPEEGAKVYLPLMLRGSNTVSQAQ